MRAYLLYIFFIITFTSIAFKSIGLIDFLDVKNVLSTHDAFRHARYSEEIYENSYLRIDYLADFPDYVVNQYPPPLLGLLTAYLSKIFKADISLFYLILPPLLSVLFIIVLYKWLQPLKNDFILIGCIVLSLFNLQYFERTKVGYFDTDCLMLFFIFLVLLFITKAVSEKDEIKSYVYTVIAGCIVILFRWWYDHLFFPLIFIVSLFLGLLIWRHRVRDVLFKLILFISLLNPLELFHYIINSPFLRDYFYGNIMNIQSFKMPINIYAGISEIQPVNLSNFIAHTTDNATTFFLGIGFFILLFIRQIRYLLPAIPFIIIGFSAFYTGYRYLIYASPFIGMGLGYFVYLFKDFILKRFNLNHRPVDILAIAMIVFLSFPAERLFFETKHLFSDEYYVSEFKKLKDITEDNAVILSWWDLGNPMQYYAKRATFMDNANFNPLKTYLTIKTLTEGDEEHAYKYISFMTNNKSKDYPQNLSELLQKASNYHEKPQSPVYLMLYDRVLVQSVLKDNSLPKDEADRISKRILHFYFPCTITKDAKADCEDIIFDIKNNSLQIVDKNVNIGYKKVVFYNKQRQEKKEFLLNERANHMILLILSKSGKMYQLIVFEDFENSLLSKMLIVNENTFKRFELVYENFPYMVLYRLK